MSRMLLGAPNYADIGPLFSPTLNSGNWLASLPLTNLQDRRMAKVARSSDVQLTSTRFREDLKTDRLVSFIGLPKHSVSQAGKIRALGVPSSLLFDYEAGDDVAALGGTFARANQGRYVDSRGVLQTAAAGVIRDGHFIGGIRHTLLERSSTNICLRSQELDDAAWTKSRSSVTANAETAPDGTLTADRLVEDGTVTNTHNAQEAVTITANANVAYSYYVKAGPRTWIALQFSDTTNTDSVTKYFNLSTGALGSTGVTGTGALVLAYAEALTGVNAGWYRCILVVNVGNGRTACSARVFLATGDNGATYSGDGASYVTLWGAQVEDASSAPTSYMQTAGATTSRVRDQLYFPLTVPVAAMTLYGDFVELNMTNWVTDNGNSPRVAQIGTLADSGARIILFKPSGSNAYRTSHYNAVPTNVDGNVTLSQTYGDRIQLAGKFNADGSVQTDGAKNGGSTTAGTPTAANTPLAATWGGNFLQIGNVNGGAGGGGDIAVRSIRLALGSNSLTTMAASVYDSGWVDAWPAVYPAGSLYTTDPRLVDGKYTAEEAVGYPMTFVAIPTTPFLMRYTSIQIDDSTNVAGFVDLPRLYVGFAYQPTINMSYGVQHGWEDDTVRTVTDGGAAIFNVKSRRRTVRGVLQDEPDDEAFANIWELQRRRGISEQLFYIFDPADTYHLARRSMLCTLRQLSPLELAVGTRDGWPFELVEDI
jgi:hypothetical protein